MSYAAKARASAAARLAAIRASESSDKRAGDGVEEDYGNDAAGPSSSAKFKRGGVVSNVDGDMPKARMDRAARTNKAMKRAMGGIVGRQGDGATTDYDMANYRRSMGLSSEEDAAAMDEAVREIRKRAMGADAEAAGGSNYGEAQGYKRGGKAGTKPMPKRAYGGPVMGDHDEPDGDEMPGPGAGMAEGEGKTKEKGKGKTIVNVIVAPQASPQAGSAASGPPMVPPPALARPAPSLPPAAAPQMAVAPMMAKPPGLDAMPMPMRKHGGRVMHGGAGGAEGRLEKSGIKEKVR